jgi:UDP-N-acetylmuramate: L-alanyl-gamma-D-glutamyl-meso-diaminopimelate ligase
MRIYFMGICGTAMGNAALLMRAAGHDVLGADTGVYPPMSTVLVAAGIKLHEGYDPARLAKLAPELVVIGNAMSRGNPEVEWLLAERALPFTSLPALLHDHILARRDNIVVCGTHGKTTTTAMTAFLLRENGRDPGYLIGGVPQDPPAGSHPGAPAAPFVIEGDEYDSAFFDKRSKFIHYAPRIAILNNLGFDHADIFRDITDIKRTFTHLTRIVPRNGAIVFNGDDTNLREVVEKVTWCEVLDVGTGKNNAVRIVDFSENAAGISFALHWNGVVWTKIRMTLPGLYNARNAAMAVVATALALGAGGRVATPPSLDAGGRAKSSAELQNRADNANASNDSPGGFAPPAPPQITPLMLRDRRDFAGPDLVPGCVRVGGHADNSRPDTRSDPARCATSVTPLQIAGPLARFRGVRRRQETLVATPALTVIEDFGHHPTALAETLESFRNRFPGATLTAVFEPRSNTARTRALQDDFARALALADEVYLGAINRAEKLAAGERFDAEAVARHLATRNIRAEAFATNAALLAKLAAATLPPTASYSPAASHPRVVIFFSNGSFDGIIAKYATVSTAAPAP